MCITCTCIKQPVRTGYFICITIRREGTVFIESAKEWESPTYSGICNIPPELLKFVGTYCMQYLSFNFQPVCCSGTIPDDWQASSYSNIIKERAVGPEIQ